MKQITVTEEELALKLPMVEVFETVEGEGLAAGFPTTFVRLFNCNLRCAWCDTPYSFAPATPAYYATIGEIVEHVKDFGHSAVCLTGGEPLLDKDKALALICALAELDGIRDIHIETNGSIDLSPFAQLRRSHPPVAAKMRFVLDYKLPGSGQQRHMRMGNYELLLDCDEIKFVVADDADFQEACRVVREHVRAGTVLLSPVWESMSPQRLVELMLKERLPRAKLSLQLHKIIWNPDARGV